MASPRRSPLLLRRAMLHSSLCFLVGLLTGLSPCSDWPAASLLLTGLVPSDVLRALHAINNRTVTLISSGSSRRYRLPPPLQQPQLLVVVTTTEQSDPERRAAGLTRTAHALRLVSPPLLWLVVEPADEHEAAPPTAKLLRGTGVVHRHLTYKQRQEEEVKNEADASSSLGRGSREEQRSVALRHIEEHRIAGVVLFGGLADVYDLRLLHRLRDIRTFGAWPAATVSAYERKVAVHGPLCHQQQEQGQEQVTGWFELEFDMDMAAAGGDPVVADRPPPRMWRDDVGGFAFSSSLLWDPHRWDRFPLSDPDISQESVKFVQRLAVEEYNHSRGMPDSACSHIMLWRIQTTLPAP